MTGTDIVLVDELFRVGANIVPAEEACLVSEFGFKVALEHKVVLKGIIQYQPVLVTVLGYVAHAHYAALTYGGVSYIPAGEDDFAGYYGIKAGKGMNEFGLAVSVNTRYTNYLACAHL